MILALVVLALQAERPPPDRPAPWSHPAATPVLRAFALGELRVVVDGRLDEVAWDRAEVATGFAQYQPDPGAPASRATEAWVAFDDGDLYVAMRLHDVSDSVAAPLTRRDDWGNADWAQVLIDSRHDRRTAYQFSVSPSAGRVDLLRLNDSEFDKAWDGVWEAAAVVDSAGWSVEMRIPLSQLSFDRRDRDRATGDVVWGISFWRWSQYRAEMSSWAPLPADGSRVVSLFGELRGLAGIGGGGGVELAPFATAAAAPGRGRDGEVAVDAGLDVRLPLTGGASTLALAVNPDFGQVEADPAVVNLTAFETFYPEKRPFFLEGTDVLRFEMGLGTGALRDERLFHSRRVGRAPQLPESSGGTWADAPRRTRILVAGKLSGRAHGWSYGVLDAVTARQSVLLDEGDGARVRRTAEPATNYLFARAVKELDRGFTTLGVAVTGTHRGNDDFAARWLPRSALVAAVDAQHRFAAGDWQVTAYAAASRVAGRATAIARLQREPRRYFQREDARHLEFRPDRTVLVGSAGDVRVEKVGGDWRGGVGGKWITPGYEMNDLGFQNLADRRLQFAWLGYYRTRPGVRFQRWSVGGSEWRWWDFGGNVVRGGVRVDAQATTAGFWDLGLSVNRESARLALEALRGGPAVLAPGLTEIEISAATDSRKRWTGRLVAGLGIEDATGAARIQVAPALRLQVGDRFLASAGAALAAGERAWQYVNTLGDAEPVYLVASLDQTTLSLEARLEWALAPDASLQLYAQPFFSAGRYTRFARDADLRAPGFGDRFRDLTATEIAFRPATRDYEVTLDGGRHFALDDPDFAVADTRATAVFRWEYRPGSTLFLAWSHERPAAIGLHRARLGDARAALADAPSAHALMIKASYWINP